MKNLVSLLLLFTTAAFSQNYNYGVDEPQKNSTPDAPSALVASNVKSSSVDLTWSAASNSTGVTDYGVYVKNAQLAKSAGKGTSYKVTGLAPETTYTLTVKAIDNTGVLSADSNSQTFTTTKDLDLNQKEEKEYFAAYLLPLAKKATLQQALDTYGVVRLEKGDYSGVNVVLHSNQSLYGHPSTNNITSITIAAGSTNVHLESLKPAQNSSLNINFQAGAVISNCTIKSMNYAQITGTGAMLENNTFIDIANSKISFDCSMSGYTRNNRVIKQTCHGNTDMLIWKGNRSTPSYGNTLIHSNYLGPQGQATDITDMESITMIGTDAESYGGITREILHISNVDKLKLFIVNGGINYASGYGFSNIDANEIYSISNINGGSNTSSKLAARANLFMINSSQNPERLGGTITGYKANSYLSQIDRDLFPHFSYNGADQITTITDTSVLTKLNNSMLSSQYTPWTRPSLDVIPDPLGANWKAERVGKPDSTTYIQNLINTNGVANLPEGIFYISSSLIMDIEAGQGLVGQGTGKTVIVGLTDDFPLISVYSPRVVGYGETPFGKVDLAYLTLQGGSSGLYVSTHALMMSFQSLKFVSFREQSSGIHFYDIFGLDNCFFEHLSFVNCDKGIYIHPWTGTLDNNYIAGSTYYDKVVFYKCQFLNCTTGLSLRASRASNLNAWVDCKFDGGNTAVNMGGDTTIFANCDFTNFTGENTIIADGLNLISCNFYGNSNSKATLKSMVNNIEGCNFLDNVPLGSTVPNNGVSNYIANSTITGNAIVVPDGTSFWTTYGTYANSRLLSNPSLSKRLVQGQGTYNGTNPFTVLIDAVPNPYPQFLVTQ